jgi:hypothetical protein
MKNKFPTKSNVTFDSCAEEPTRSLRNGSLERRKKADRSGGKSLEGRETTSDGEIQNTRSTL